MSRTNVNDLYIAWQKYIVKHRPSEILKKLEQLIQDDGGIFRDDSYFQEFRNLALLFRIDLLMEWERFAEALAWLCLETELNPANVDAVAMKEQQKKQLHFTKDENHVAVKSSTQKPLFNRGNVAGMRRIKAIIERDVLLPL